MRIRIRITASEVMNTLAQKRSVSAPMMKTPDLTRPFLFNFSISRNQFISAFQLRWFTPQSQQRKGYEMGIISKIMKKIRKSDSQEITCFYCQLVE